MLSAYWCRRSVLLAGLGAAALLSARARAVRKKTMPALERLIGRMTIEEKAGQLTILPAAHANAPATAANPTAVNNSIEAQADAVRAGRIGALFNGSNAAWHRDMQEAAVRESRLGIPLLFQDLSLPEALFDCAQANSRAHSHDSEKSEHPAARAPGQRPLGRECELLLAGRTCPAG